MDGFNDVYSPNDSFYDNLNLLSPVLSENKLLKKEVSIYDNLNLFSADLITKELCEKDKNLEILISQKLNTLNEMNSIFHEYNESQKVKLGFFIFFIINNVHY